MSTPSAFLDLTETLDTLDDYVGVMDDFDSVEIESVIVGFSNDPKFRYALIEWVAKSHNNTTKRKRKQVVQISDMIVRIARKSCFNDMIARIYQKLWVSK